MRRNRAQDPDVQVAEVRGVTDVSERASSSGRAWLRHDPLAVDHKGDRADRVRAAQQRDPQSTCVRYGFGILVAVANRVATRCACHCVSDGARVQSGMPAATHPPNETRASDSAPPADGLQYELVPAILHLTQRVHSEQNRPSPSRSASVYTLKTQVIIMMGISRVP